jgi:hemerythrin-like domain-containing protein
MKPTDVLKEEHDLILVMLQVLDAACAKMEEGEKVEASHLSDMVDFIRNFADACHHAKEEKLLFPALEQAGIARDGGPLGVMLAEHTAGRNFVKGMNGALVEMNAGDDMARERFIQDARGYVQLLDGHIMKENNVLFMMADDRLNGEKQKELMAGFDRVENEEIGAGVHEKYHEMLHRLRDIYLADKQ